MNVNFGLFPPLERAGQEGRAQARAWRGARSADLEAWLGRAGRRRREADR